MGGDDILIGGEAAGRDEDEAVLEDRGGEAENEVHVASDTARVVELAEGVGTEGVLVPDEFTAFDDGSIAV